MEIRQKAEKKRKEKKRKEKKRIATKIYFLRIEKKTQSYARHSHFLDDFKGSVSFLLVLRGLLHSSAGSAAVR